MSNTELQFQIAIRDQIIDNQREVLGNLWAVLKGSGLQQKQVLELALRQGITIEEWGMPSRNSSPHRARSPFSNGLSRFGSCGRCITSELVEVTSVTSRYLECAHNTSYSCSRNSNIKMASPRVENQEYYSTRRRNELFNGEICTGGQ